MENDVAKPLISYLEQARAAKSALLAVTQDAGLSELKKAACEEAKRQEALEC